MKVKVGNKLKEIRDDRRWTSEFMADTIGMSLSAYSRLERNETQIELDRLLKISECLKVPIQDFLPETMSIQNNVHDKGVGIVWGNYIVNTSQEELIKQYINENENLNQKITLLESYIENLKDEISNLKEVITLLKR